MNDKSVNWIRCVENHRNKSDNYWDLVSMQYLLYAAYNAPIVG